jgi:hypothetical protein
MDGIGMFLLLIAFLFLAPVVYLMLAGVIWLIQELFHELIFWISQRKKKQP